MSEHCHASADVSTRYKSLTSAMLWHPASFNLFVKPFQHMNHFLVWNYWSLLVTSDFVYVWAQAYSILLEFYSQPLCSVGDFGNSEWMLDLPFWGFPSPLQLLFKFTSDSTMDYDGIKVDIHSWEIFQHLGHCAKKHFLVPNIFWKAASWGSRMVHCKCKLYVQGNLPRSCWCLQFAKEFGSCHLSNCFISSGQMEMSLLQCSCSAPWGQHQIWDCSPCDSTVTKASTLSIGSPVLGSDVCWSCDAAFSQASFWVLLRPWVLVWPPLIICHQMILSVLWVLSHVML